MRLSNNSILVTGACGFIGRHLVERLQKERARLICVDDLSLGKKTNISEEVLVFDVKSVELFNRLKKEEIDIIYHLGTPCSVIQFNADPVKALHSTIQGFYSMITLASLKGARLIYPSSGTVYGNRVYQKEEAIPSPINLYGVSKNAVERMVALSGLDAIGLRIFAGYGPGEDHKGHLSSAVTLFLNDILNDKRPQIWGNGEQTRDFVYIDDVIECLLRSVGVRKFPIVNVGSGRSASFNKVVRIINRELGKSVEPNYVEKPMLYLEMTRANVDLMKKIFDIEPLGLEKGLQKYISKLERLRPA